MSGECNVCGYDCYGPDCYVCGLRADSDRLFEALKRIAQAHAPAEHLQSIARDALRPKESDG